ncbi:MAG: hypothetical protein H0U74_08195 [Bradymonadaceae bacterium]|nr:hypothetical protein [Lujinxingiaceae bacterium]
MLSWCIGRLGVLALLAISVFPAMAAEASVVEEDRTRIRAHLIEVEQELRARNVSHFSVQLQEARRQNLDRLREYRIAGAFPHNTHVPWQQPVFIDRDERRCAVAHLMFESGAGEQARRIAARENLSYLPEMTSPELAEWVSVSGLSADEAAWIQPTYNHFACADDCSCDPEPVCGDDGVTYVNACFAERCGNAKKWLEGCCSRGAQIDSTASYNYRVGTQCPNDPNNERDVLCPGKPAHPDAWHYPDGKEPEPDVEPQHDNDVEPAREPEAATESETSSCATVSSDTKSGTSPASLLLTLIALLLVAGRRRPRGF